MYISYYEHNYSTPDAQTLVKIADFFNVSLDYLLGRTSK
ncbi:helix-turn-helix domain-containing protein [Mobilisporobacter senegalensis]|nr:helix-turn-helix transcriptional regulator [Mobilisporobacter senegalensis]